MTLHQWEVVERSLEGLSVDEKREIADRILRSIPAGSLCANRVREQYDALTRLCQAVEAIPTAQPGDGLSNRDHDRILYTR